MITVVSPGTRTLVQDHGRPAYAHLGVPTSGAADLTSHRLANRLAGNPDDTAALEIALHGPVLTFQHDTVIGYVGADTDLYLDGHRVPVGHTLPVAAGQTLTVGAVRGGIYGYLAIAGGILVDPTLGSRSTCILSGLGPSPLAAGDRLPVTAPAPGLAFLACTHSPELAGPVRLLPGPHGHLFDADAADRLVSTDWAVSPSSSRVGIRLTGVPLAAPQASLPSLGMVRGAIQVPPSGEPIVLSADHGATGGYPVLGVVLPQDLAALAQAVPGEPVRFAAVSLAEAAEAEQATEAALVRSLLRLERIAA